MSDAFVPKLLTLLQAGYSLADLRKDAVAGLTVAIVALPLAMALSIASGASPEKGLITAIIAGFLISALGGSRVQIGGPTGAFVVVVSGVIARHGFDGLVMATFLAGLILIIAGYAGVGKLLRYIPIPVITGFTAGIAVIIASSQVGDFLGLATAGVPADFLGKWSNYAGVLNSLQWQTTLLAISSFGTILLLRRFAPQIPGYLLIIVVASAVVWYFNLPIATVGERFPQLPTALPAPHWPDVSLVKLREVLPSAFTIAFLAGIEALLSAVVADGMTGYRHRPGQELVAQGWANCASALFGGLPATGAIARTATNVRAGGKTPVAGILHAVFLLAMLLLAGSLIKLVPMAVLAAILMVVAWGMSEVERFRGLLRMPGGDRLLLLLTFALTVLVDLTVAIAVGVTLASLLFMANMSEAASVSQDDPATGSTGDDESQRTELPKGVEVFRFDGPMFFGVANEMLDTLQRIGRHPSVIILRMGRVPYIDSTGANALQQFILQAGRSGTKVVLCELNEASENILRASGVMGIVAAATYSLATAIQHCTTPTNHQNSSDARPPRTP